MKQKLLTLIKTPGAVIGVIISILLLVIKALKNKNSDLESEKLQADAKKTDAVLAQQQKDLAAQNAAEISMLEAEKKRKLTDEELNEFLRKL